MKALQKRVDFLTKLFKKPKKELIIVGCISLLVVLPISFVLCALLLPNGVSDWITIGICEVTTLGSYPLIVHYREIRKPREKSESKPLSRKFIAAFILCSFAFLLFAFQQWGFGIFFIVLWLIVVAFVGPPKVVARLTSHGSARWATQEDMDRVFPGNTGLYLSGWLYLGDGHLITFAPPRSGKGAAIIIPNLLNRPWCSFFVTDPKGELACITARAQKAFGQRVLIIDPWGLQKKNGSTHGIPAAGFNPFAFLRINLHELPDYCQMMAEFIIPHNPGAREPFWDNKARSLIKLLLVHIVTYLPKEKQTFWTLYKMLRTDQEDFIKLIVDMKLNTALDGYVQAGANELMASVKAPETWGSILIIAHNGTSIFESPELRKSLETSNFNPHWLADGRTTVYVVIPERYRISHGAWLKMITSICLKATNQKPGKKVVFMIDEAANLGKMNELIDSGYAIGAGQNIQMWTFFQDVEQLDTIYGKGNGLLAKSYIKMFFNIGDYYTQELVSKMLGNKTIESVTTNSKNERSYGEMGRPLMTPDEVGKEPGIITFIGSLKTVLDKQFYWKPCRKDDKWFEYFKRMADPPPRA